MSAPEILAGLSQIADRYDVLLCDVWGVIHNGRQNFPAACEALARFQRERGPVVLISNSPRPAQAVRPQLTELGVPDYAWTSFITSGDATRALLAERAPGPAWRIGPERDDVLYEGLGLHFAGPSEAAFIACSGPVDDDVDTPEDYRADLQVAAERGLTMICANPDRVVHRGDKLIYCGGALADLYQLLGGPVIMAGKPYPAIYDLCLAEAAVLLGRQGRALCIGDGAPTDVKGAQAMGLDCLFIFGGIHGGELAGDRNGIGRLLAEHGTAAPFAMPSLSW
ncbi:MAG TPA: TIGR01459 family HAD-type hydrolase [Caulobacteraceae bacterium]|nr:TIGR01459 family HAD-type hydrolase [Caulobacteraceae bacterium]